MNHNQNQGETDGLGSIPEHNLYYTKWVSDGKEGMKEDGVRYNGGTHKEFYRFSNGEALEWHSVPGRRDRVGVIVMKDGSRVLLEDWIKAYKSNQLSALQTVRLKAEDFHTALLEQLNPSSPEKQSAAAGIFDKLYDIWKNKEDASYIMLKAVKRSADHIDGIEKERPSSKVLFDEVWAMMAKYLTEQRKEKNEKDYENRKSEVEEYFISFKNHISSKVGNKEVDPKTAKVFLRMLPKLSSLHDSYNVITKNADREGNVHTGKDQEYANLANTFFQRKPGKNKQDEGMFFHFNVRDSSVPTTLYRFYISANLRAAPSKVLSNFMAALQETGLMDKIYFKIPQWHGNRYESIIIYANEDVSRAYMEKLLSSFLAKTPDSLLTKDNMPGGVPLRPGLTMAPEPLTINRVLKFSGLESHKMSYNQMIAQFMELSFMMAYHEHGKTGKKRETPGNIRQTAKKYFDQFLILAGVDPKTMLLTTADAQKMAWVGEIVDSYKKQGKRAA